MHRKHRHSPFIREQHRAQMSDRRSAINLRPRHDVTPPLLASLGGSTGQKNERTGKLSRIITRKIGELERDVADRRNVINTAHRLRIRATLLAVTAIGTHRLELMAKDLERQRFETFIHRLVDKGEYSLVNL